MAPCAHAMWSVSAGPVRQAQLSRIRLSSAEERAHTHTHNVSPAVIRASPILSLSYMTSVGAMLVCRGCEVLCVQSYVPLRLCRGNTQTNDTIQSRT